MEDGMVSIIVPVYNGAKYLESCVESLRAQTYEKLEILLVDDGSTDGSSELCDRLSGEDARIRAIHTENGGVSAARNRGMEEAKGEYLSFVDADDLAAPDMIEYLVGLMERTGSDVAGCGFLEFREQPKNGTEKESGKKSDDEADRDVPEILRGKEFVGRGILCGDTRCWSKLYKKEIIGTDRFEQGLTIGEDMLFLLGLARKNAVFSRGRYAGYFYFINSQGAMNRRFKDSYMDQVTCWREAFLVIASEYPEYRAKAASLLMMAVMLTAGKLALLSAEERRDGGRERYVKVCLEQLRRCRRVRGAWRALDTGYRIKVCAFLVTPSVYLNLYRRLKKKEQSANECNR